MRGTTRTGAGGRLCEPDRVLNVRWPRNDAAQGAGHAMVVFIGALLACQRLRAVLELPGTVGA